MVSTTYMTHSNITIYKLHLKTSAGNVPGVDSNINIFKNSACLSTIQIAFQSTLENSELSFCVEAKELSFKSTIIASYIWNDYTINTTP